MAKTAAEWIKGLQDKGWNCNDQFIAEFEQFAAQCSPLPYARKMFADLGLVIDFIKLPDKEIGDATAVQISEVLRNPFPGSRDSDLTAMAQRRSVNIKVFDKAPGRIKTVRVRNFGQVDID